MISRKALSHFKNAKVSLSNFASLRGALSLAEAQVRGEIYHSLSNHHKNQCSSLAANAEKQRRSEHISQ